jgi:GxxExxY protein
MYPKQHDSLTQVIGLAIDVHRALGPGLMEATYEEALCIEIESAGLPYSRQLRIPVTYKGRTIGEYRPDLVIASHLVVEVKSVERLIGLHQAQLLAYMRVLKASTGLLLNFNGEVLRTGVKRLALEVAT